MKDKIGVIGVGGVGGYAHIPSYLDNKLNISAISDINEEILMNTKRKFDINSCYTKASELIADPNVDIVDIATPPSTHLELLQLANKNKKNVVMQKPMCCNYAEFEEIKKVLENDQHIILNTTGREVSAWKKIKELIDKSEIGRCMLCTISNNDWWDRSVERWDHEIENYIIFEMAIHHLDLCLYWFGKPKRIVARGGSNNEQKLKQMNWIVITLEYENGLVVNLTENWSMSEFKFANGHPFEDILITGEKGAIRANSEMVEVSKIGKNSIGTWHYPRPGQVLPGENLTVNWFIDSFGEAMKDYINRFSSGDTLAEDKKHAIELTELTFLVSEAVKSNSWVEVK